MTNKTTAATFEIDNRSAVEILESIAVRLWNRLIGDGPHDRATHNALTEAYVMVADLRDYERGIL